MKLNPKHPTTVYCATPELGMVFAQIMKCARFHLSLNLTREKVSDFFLSNFNSTTHYRVLSLQNNSVSWMTNADSLPSPMSNDAALIQSLADIQRLFFIEPIQIAGYEVKTDRGGVVVGCAAVHWNVMDKIQAEKEKIQKTVQYACKTPELALVIGRILKVRGYSLDLNLDPFGSAKELFNPFFSDPNGWRLVKVADGFVSWATNIPTPTTDQITIESYDDLKNVFPERIVINARTVQYSKTGLSVGSDVFVSWETFDQIYALKPVCQSPT